MHRSGSMLLTLALSACARPNAAYDPGGAEDGETGAQPTSTTAGPTSTDPPLTSGIGTTAGVTTDAAETGPDSSTTAPPPDMGVDPAGCPAISGPCDLADPAACEMGSRCRPWSDGVESGLSCVKNVPPRRLLQIGDQCEHRCGLNYGVDDCPEGSICDPFEDATPACLELCDAVEMCTDGACIDAGGFGLCRSPGPLGCDPLLQDCPDDQACYPGSMGCIEAGSLPAGSPCAFANDCQAGLVCADGVGVDANCLGGVDTCCVALCDFEDPNACGVGQTCIHWDDGFHICVP